VAALSGRVGANPRRTTSSTLTPREAFGVRRPSAAFHPVQPGKIPQAEKPPVRRPPEAPRYRPCGGPLRGTPPRNWRAAGGPPRHRATEVLVGAAAPPPRNAPEGTGGWAAAPRGTEAPSYRGTGRAAASPSEERPRGTGRAGGGPRGTALHAVLIFRMLRSSSPSARIA
jgi:hypothetical protein